MRHWNSGNHEAEALFCPSLNYQALQAPEQLGIKPEQNPQHSSQIHLGYVFFGQGAYELVHVLVCELDEELFKLEAAG